MNVLKYLFKAVATGLVFYFLPELARVTQHGWGTLILGAIALLAIWTVD